MVIVNVLTNQTWFSLVFTLIDNDTRHHGGKNVVESRGTHFDWLVLIGEFKFQARCDKTVHKQIEMFAQEKTKLRTSKKKVSTMFPAGLEPATFRVWGGRDNHYTTETATEEWLNINEPVGKLCTLYILPICLLFSPERGPQK